MGDVEDANERAYERWRRYEEEAAKANTAHRSLVDDGLGIEMPFDYPTITVNRYSYVRTAAAYTLMRNALAELFGLDPETMTQQEVIERMAQRAYRKRHVDGEWRCRCPSDPDFDKSMNPPFVARCDTCGATRP